MSNNGVPLKSGLGVIQGHRKWQHSTNRTRLPIICKYSSRWYHFRDILCLTISWPWNSG